jgi:hypothetical protein
MGNRDGRAMTYRNTNTGRRHCESYQASNDFWPLFTPIKRNGWACGRRLGSHAASEEGVFGTSPRVACRLHASAGRNPTPKGPGALPHEAYFAAQIRCPLSAWAL